MNIEGEGIMEQGGFRVPILGFGVEGLGATGLEIRVQGSGFLFLVCSLFTVLCLECSVQRLKIWVRFKWERLSF